jgi:2,4-dichlorophenol 6-monooxygenase
VEVLRDLGVEEELMADAMPQDLTGAQIFAMPFAGIELRRTTAWGAGLDRRSDYLGASPSAMCNIPQHKLELGNETAADQKHEPSGAIA